MAISTGGRSGRRVMAEINITPFTDVCLVLLIIFMISASFVGSAPQKAVKLPKATDKATNTLPTQDVTITLAGDGGLYLTDRKVSFADLYSNLKEYSQKSKVHNVIIRADKNVLYDQVVKVMDAVRQTGMSYMSLAVEQEKPVQ